MADHTFGGKAVESATQARTRNRPLPAPPPGGGVMLPPKGVDEQFVREAGSMYGGRMASPFTTGLSKHREAPGFSFPGAGRKLGLVRERKNEDASEPPESSSIGVQLLSENKTLPALSFRKAGAAGGVALSADDELLANEPTSTTYTPQFQAVQPRIPAYGLSDRLGGEKWTDKFAAVTGPGSYDEQGSVGNQVASTKSNAPRATFSTVDRLKFMSDFAIA